METMAEYGDQYKLEYDIAEPRPSSLIESLRSVGYSLSTAIADVIDNSITAGARNVLVDFHWDGENSVISITDDGRGMTEDELVEAMRPGSCNPSDIRDGNDLGRFGLGLKTASFSQCRRLSVLTRAVGAPVAARTWDLDEVVRCNEWRLAHRVEGAEKYEQLLHSRHCGTVVIWNALDRLTAGTLTQCEKDHSHFIRSIDQVSLHLGMTFHRFIEEGSVQICMNGNPIEAWDPFMKAHPSTYLFPEEVIPFGASYLRFRGYVLPHRDMMTDEEMARAAGPYGWLGHQGFYVYRSRRLLVSGDWLRIGSPSPWARQEHYNLARIMLDLPNDTDEEWHIDVKKSTARPPAIIREKLTGLAEIVRQRARETFAHRGRYGKRTSPVSEFIRPWQISQKQNRRIYRINRSHPLVVNLSSAETMNRDHFETLLRLLEETVPIEQIWLDIAEMPREPASPYDTVDLSEIRADLSRLFQIMLVPDGDTSRAKRMLRQLEPFNRFGDLIEEL